jgi:riboflavin synthase
MRSEKALNYTFDSNTCLLQVCLTMGVNASAVSEKTGLAGSVPIGILPVTLFLFSQRKTVFTGLIHTLGKIRPLRGDRFEILPEKSENEPLGSDLAVGDSLAVDGICLTAEAIAQSGSFVATVSPETLRRTRLGQLDPARDRVNLEPSLRAGGKLGGHFVTGHVDGVGCLVEAVRREQAIEMTFAPVPVSSLRAQWESAIARFLVEKGSIAVNGISLTVAECDADGFGFKVAVIPHTYAQTNLCDLQPGSWVNLESDILGKYVEKLLGYREMRSRASEDINLAFLAENGYIQ